MTSNTVEVVKFAHGGSFTARCDSLCGETPFNFGVYLHVEPCLKFLRPRSHFIEV